VGLWFVGEMAPGPATWPLGSRRSGVRESRPCDGSWVMTGMGTPSNDCPALVLAERASVDDVGV